MCSIVDVEVVVTIHVQAGELGVVLVITCTVVIRIIPVAFLTIINIIVIINIINVNIIIINTRQKLAYGRTMGENHSFWLLKRFLIFQGISGDLDANLLKHISLKIQ